ncbi:hypothetical protein BD769DRAFT_1383090 [Suillus cothurnatus]|nr:hypothetical protein BD769DRAFT_1383090 [Suillus cothurnatus]
MARSGHSIHSTSGRHRAHQPQTQKLTDKEIAELKSYLPDWTSAKRRICSGNDKAVMPWSAIIQSQDDFVARKYLPLDVDLKEPSNLQNWDTTALLNFWYAQQESGKTQTFLFKAWKNKDGDMVTSVVSGKPPSHPTQNIRKKQRPGATLITQKRMLMMTRLMVDPHKRDPEEQEVLHQQAQTEQLHSLFQSPTWSRLQKVEHLLNHRDGYPGLGDTHNISSANGRVTYETWSVGVYYFQQFGAQLLSPLHPPEMFLPKPFEMVNQFRVVVLWKGQEDVHDALGNEQVDLGLIALPQNEQNDR